MIFSGCPKGQKLNEAQTECMEIKQCPTGQSAYFGLKCVSSCPGELIPINGHCPIQNCPDPNVRLGRICCEKDQFNINDVCSVGPCEEGTFKGFIF